MRKLDRKSIQAPKCLTAPSSAVQNERVAAEAYYATRIPWLTEYTSHTFTAYRNPEVRLALRRLAGGNCAFCESKIGAVGARQIEHYRPKGKVEGLPGHTGYWWLASDWENLLPTCRDCNQGIKQHIVTENMTREDVETLLSKPAKHSFGKASKFEVRGRRAIGIQCNLVDEDPLLIDPSRRDPALELVWKASEELPIVRPSNKVDGPSACGGYTIQTCGLNRAELVLDRISVRRPMRAIRTRVLKTLESWDGEGALPESISAEINCLCEFAHPEQIYAGMAAAFIADFLLELEQWLLDQGLAPIGHLDI